MFGEFRIDDGGAVFHRTRESVPRLRNVAEDWFETFRVGLRLAALTGKHSFRQDDAK